MQFILKALLETLNSYVIRKNMSFLLGVHWSDASDYSDWFGPYLDGLDWLDFALSGNSSKM